MHSKHHKVIDCFFSHIVHLENKNKLSWRGIIWCGIAISICYPIDSWLAPVEFLLRADHFISRSKFLMLSGVNIARVLVLNFWTNCHVLQWQLVCSIRDKGSDQRRGRAASLQAFLGGGDFIELTPCPVDHNILEVQLIGHFGTAATKTVSNFVHLFFPWALKWMTGT